ncbi:hypothetical protein WOLCODRAFT_25257 [Wolfiporia cocos MD-104 SS10]|uniref:Uncharacterized protein n=1 Tax=Wolfiporia cocos (strain MD-104) TaxID=742152 RepID=A0A2H3JJB5_WOLCO|nr:hypothetical protein WOLCODRAFT_25257 [Wolfiporia cocos MD-104 SS10]
MSFVNSVQAGERVHHFLWEEWGPAHTYMMYAPRKHNEAWPNFVYGTKYVYPRTRGTEMVIEVMDFNPLPMIRHLAGLDNPSVEDFLKCGWVNRPSWTDADDVFVDRLEGTLPFRVQTLMPPPIEGQVEFRHVMISEDSLITLGGQSHSAYLRILSF